MNDAKELIAKVISDLLENNISTDEIVSLLEIPKLSENGDLAFPCFRLAKLYKKAPALIADELKGKIESNMPSLIKKVEAVSGYLNFFVDNTSLNNKIVQEILETKDKCVEQEIGKGKTVCVDYSSPNIAKPFHIGHLRSTVIGAAICNIYKALGYNVVGINHLGDFGTQFGYVIEGYKMWGKDYDLTVEPIKKLVEIYVKINALAKEDESIVERARNNFKLLEEGDKDTVALWETFRNYSLQEYKRIYDKLDIHFDSYNGEAFYNDKMQEIVDILNKSGKLEESQGAQVVNVKCNDVPCMILKSNGSTTYATRDLAAVLYRAREYNYDKCLYLTGYEQILHFKQVFEVAENIVGHEKAQGLEHVPFGMILGPGGKKFSTRKGAAATIDDVLNDAIDKAREILEAKGKVEDNIEETAAIIGIGSVIFNDLKNNRIKDEVFDLDEMLKFEGETGPYVQYTYVRTQSILAKAGVLDLDFEYDASILNEKSEIALIKLLENRKEIVKNASVQNEPSIITRYVIDVASEFSKYYGEHQIIVDDEKLKCARLALVKATGFVIKACLGLLGIKSPNKM